MMQKKRDRVFPLCTYFARLQTYDFFNTLCYWVYNCTVSNFLHEARSTSLIAYSAKRDL